MSIDEFFLSTISFVEISHHTLEPLVNWKKLWTRYDLVCQHPERRGHLLTKHKKCQVY